MKIRIPSLFKNKIVLASAVVVATLGLAGAATVAQFGPDRPVKAYVQHMKGFDHVTFNSFTGVPNIGDERNFLTGKIDQAPDGFYDPMNQVRDGNEILVRVYVHNNADPSLNASGKGVAKNVRVRAEVPTTLASAQQTKAFITADNAQPKEIYDTLDINAKYPFELDYVEGSAHLDSNYVNDLPLSDNIVKGGVLIGDDKLDGNINGCFEYVALITYRVKVKAPNFNIQKSVRLMGEDSTKWRENATAQPGSTVEWKLEFKNTGKTQLNSVDIFDQLPAKMSLVNDTTMIYNGNHPSGVNAGSNNVVKNGIDVGNYGAGSNAIVVFKAKVPEVKDLECGTNTFLNKGYAKPEGQNIVTDNASVTVTKKCDNPETPVYSCDLLQATKLGGRKVSYTTSASASGGAVITEYVYDFGDGSGELKTNSNKATHTYAKDGKYTTKVKVLVKVGDQIKTATSQNCEAFVQFKEEQVPEYSCDLLTLTKTGNGREVKLNAKASASGGATVQRYVYSFGDGTPDLTTDKAEVTHTYAKDGKYSSSVKAQISIGNSTKFAESDKCAATVEFTTPKTPETPPQTPVTPGKLPETGAGGIIATFLAVTATSTVGYYVVARRALRF